MTLRGPAGGEWRQSRAALRDAPVGLCEGCGHLIYSGWIYLVGQPAVIKCVVCDICAATVTE